MHQKTVIDNGVRIISERIDHLQSVSLGIWVNSGSRDEVEEQNGVSHFIEHMTFKGTRNRTSLQIAKELDAIGGLSNAFTSKENTCFHTRVLGKHFEVAAEILADIFLNSVFNPEDVERERQVIFQEIGMQEDAPEENIHVLLQRLFWRDHPIGFPVLGTDRSVSGLCKDDLLEHMGQHYVPDNVLVVAAGNVEHQALVDFFAPRLQGLPPRQPAAGRTSPRHHPGVECCPKDLEQVHLCLGGPAPSLSDERRFACALLNTVVGGNMSSRLFQEVRENRGLAYAVYSFISAYLDAGLMGIYLATDAENVNQALSTIQAEIRKLIGGRLSEEDLSAAKEHMAGGIYLSAENADNRMMRLAKNELLYRRFVDYDELVRDLWRVTREEVVETAAEIYREGNTSLVTLGPFEQKDLDVIF